MKVCKLFSNDYVKQNVLNHNPDDFGGMEKLHIKIGNSTVYPSVALKTIKNKEIGLNTFVRNHHQLAIGDIVDIKLGNPSDVKIKEIDIKLIPYSNTNSEMLNFHEENIKESFLKEFCDYYLYTNQCLYFDMKKSKFIVYVTNICQGYCDKNTKINLTSGDISLNIIGNTLMKRDIFKDDYDFEQLGIGGLDKQLIDILRRCLSTRAYKKEIIEKLGITHVKGMLLYGSPGCGKTLIARKIGSIISNKIPKIVNGPEILDKFVGNSESKIRELFSEALVDKSEEIHVIIFDEIDAICKTRKGGNVGAGVNDNIVNQLLTMIDGYTQLNNIFIIAMTNRKDLLDEALLRAGRLEVHIEIGLPDKKGREQIFKIHTKNMVTNNMVKDFDADLFSSLTENYTGAEIESVVKNAVTRALHENLLNEMSEKGKAEEYKVEDALIVSKKHFMEAIEEIVPMFGKNNRDIFNLISELKENSAYIETVKNQINNSKERIESILIKGPKKSGKTSLPLKAALETGINNIKIVRAIDMISFGEIEKVEYIGELVKKSYMSKDTVIIIDDVEIFLNYIDLGSQPIFSNRLYQLLVTIFKTPPPNKAHKIFYISTCSQDIPFLNKVFNLEISLETDLKKKVKR